jgi:hypothetical protein
VHDISAEALATLLREGETLTRVFRRTCPDAKDIASTLLNLAASGGGILIVGVDGEGRPGLLPNRETADVLGILQRGAARITPETLVNAAQVGSHWVAYAMADAHDGSMELFPDLTRSQRALLLCLIREGWRQEWSAEVVAIQTFGTGWCLLFSPVAQGPGREINGTFEETDLHALRDEGYITLLSRKNQYNLTLKPKAHREYAQASPRSGGDHSTQILEGASGFDVFLCHAGPDKAVVVEPLVAEIKASGISCWYDVHEIRWGQSLSQRISDGLRRSRFVIVVLSESFLGRPWPEKELGAALASEGATGYDRVLPLIVGDTDAVTRILETYPLITDKLYLKWNGDSGTVVKSLRRLLNQ